METTPLSKSSDLRSSRKALAIIILSTTYFAVTTTIQFACYYQAPLRQKSVCQNTETSTVSKIKSMIYSREECFEVPVNPEKTPERFYHVLYNKTTHQGRYLRQIQLVFNISVPLQLQWNERLVVLSDVMTHLAAKLRVNVTWVTKKVRLVYDDDSRQVIFHKCFNAATLLNELIQVDISNALKGAYITLVVDQIII